MVQFQFVSDGATKAEYYGSVEDIPYEPHGVCESRSCREELRGQPTFTGWCGPMWGGHMIDGEHKFDGTGIVTIRYESWESYERLSR